jgi:hypothetical protein
MLSRNHLDAQCALIEETMNQTERIAMLRDRLLLLRNHTAVSANQMLIIDEALSATAAQEDAEPVAWYGLLIKGTHRLSETCDSEEEARHIVRVLASDKHDIIKLYTHPDSNALDAERWKKAKQHCGVYGGFWQVQLQPSNLNFHVGEVEKLEAAFEADIDAAIAAAKEKK